MADDSEKASEERSKFRGIGCSWSSDANRPAMATVQCDFFAEFMRRRFPNEKDESYINEWAERFKKGEEFHHADSESRKILLEIMVEGPGDGTASHLNEKDVETFCGCKRVKKSD